MNTLKIKRGISVDQTLYYSTEGGEFRFLLVDHLKDAKLGQRLAYSPQSVNSQIAPYKKFTIDSEGNIEMPAEALKVTITTMWYKYLISNSGEILELGTQSMNANDADVPAFIHQLGGTITLFMVNGRIRKINGYNSYPVFGQNGVIEYTEVQLEEIAAAEPNTIDYDHKKADGSWIYPELHPAPVVEEPIEEPVITPADDTL